MDPMLSTESYIFVIRSQDRAPHGETNNFRVGMPFMPMFARHDHWRVCVKKVIIPNSRHDGTHPYHYSDRWQTSLSTNFINSDFVEIRIDMGGTTTAYDTSLRGGRFVHFYAPEFRPSGDIRPNSGHIDNSVYYTVSRPELSELSVSAYDDAGSPLDMTALLDGSRAPMSEWILVLEMQAINSRESC